ncbi:hypothetical protein CP533_2977 [Ophiocordyceps camponoti-saundersi (nom. inval.)]|nr:hypothetical protein CP533_2977 [Ophiocordyceps camponoti-saundersi (nom. inval.)]
MSKTSAAAERWAQRAERIRKGEKKSAWDVLKERGFIKDVAGNSDAIGELIRLKRIGAYLGVDPTSDSMHIGHLFPLMALFWLWFEGHPATLVLGGATARIGDPIGRTDSRPEMSNADISRNITKLHFQMTKLWFNVDAVKRNFNVPDDWAAKHALLNNGMWQNGLTMYEFNKRISRHIRMGPMLSREWVKQRLSNNIGMSFGEFMYPLLQGWDFWHLYNKIGCQMQIGGADQFGNIVTGIETVKIIRETEEQPTIKMEEGWLNEPVGFTTPLFTDAKGQKLGKSDDNASKLSLDEFQTSPFNLYGFFVRQPDKEVERLLKLLTFHPMDKIQSIMEEHWLDPTKRVAQHELAFQVLCLVHGTQRAKLEATQHSVMHQGAVDNCAKWSLDSPHPVDPNNAPNSDIQLPDSVMDLPPGKILLAAGLVGSTSDGHRLVSCEGAYVAAQTGNEHRSLVPGSLSWIPMKLWFPGESRKFLIDGKLLILRKGKHNIRIIRLLSDEEWGRRGVLYPGEARTGKIRRLKEHLLSQANKRGQALSESQLASQVRTEANRKQSPDSITIAWWKEKTLNSPTIRRPSDEPSKSEGL